MRSIGVKKEEEEEYKKKKISEQQRSIREEEDSSVTGKAFKRACFYACSRTHLFGVYTVHITHIHPRMKTRLVAFSVQIYVSLGAQARDGNKRKRWKFLGSIYIRRRIQQYVKILKQKHTALTFTKKDVEEVGDGKSVQKGSK